MLEFLKISEVIISILLMAIILIQNKSVTLNLSSMGWWMTATTKRGAEKILHNLTIILWVLFIVNSLVFFLYK